MVSGFKEKITGILEQTGPDILKDRQRFISAIQDTGAQYSRERKLISRCMDSTFFAMCIRATESSVDQMPVISQQAADYLVREYMVSDDWAKNISDALVGGIGAYFNRDEMNGNPDMIIAQGSAARAGGMMNGPETEMVDYIPIMSNEYDHPEPRSGGSATKKILIVCAAVILGLGIGVAAFLGMSSSDEQGGSDEAEAEDVAIAMTVDDIQVERFDVNFSQITNQTVKRSMSFETDGLDVLIRIKNNSEDEILRGISFKYKQNGREIESVVNENNTFNAYGLIEPGETGYMYSKIMIPNSTDREQGDIQPVEIISVGNPDGYELATGTVGSINKETDAYDVRVVNNTSNTLHTGASVIAVMEGVDNLGAAWGAGILDADIEPGEEHLIRDALYNPGFDNEDDKPYNVFVIDPQYLQ